MSKPTLFQTLFHQPSRKYSPHPSPHFSSQLNDDGGPDKVIYRSRVSLNDHKDLKAALYEFPTTDAAPALPYAAGSSAPSSSSSTRPSSSAMDVANTTTTTTTTSRRKALVKRRPSSSQTAASQATSAEVQDDAVGSTTSTSRPPITRPVIPLTPGDTDGSNTRHPAYVQPPLASDKLPKQRPQSHAVTPTAGEKGRQGRSQETYAHRNDTQHDDTDESDTDEEEDEDVFYTPRSSPESSPFTSPASKPPPSLASMSNTVVTTVTASPAGPNDTATRPTSSLSLKPRGVTWSAASSALSLSSTSSPPSEYGLNNSSYAPSESTSPTSLFSEKFDGSDHRHRTRSPDHRPPIRRRSLASSSTTSVDASWAKDVRWLVKPEAMDAAAKAKAVPQRTWTHSASGRASPSPSPSSYAASSSVSSLHEDPLPTPRRRSVDSPSDYLREVQIPQRPPRRTPSRSKSSSPTPGQQQPRRRPAPTAAPSTKSDPKLQRMSAVLEVDEAGNTELVIGTAHPSVLHRHVVPERSLSRRGSSSARTRTSSDPTSDASAPKRAASVRSSETGTSYKTSYQTVELSTTLPVTNGDPTYSNGYTSLVLPRAAYTPGKNPISSSVDLTRSGLAQTTMSTISVIKGGAVVQGQRRLSFRGILSRSSSTSSVPRGSAAKGKGVAESALALTSNTPPPSKLQSSQVLVRVWAVALDALDRLIVSEKCSKSEGYGFVPGRSFAGRVVEAGWEVTAVQKGDWICGLLELGKSGALSEFVVVDKRRVCRVPDPAPSASAEGRGRGLTLERMALLPLVGLPVSRAARSLPRMHPTMAESKTFVGEKAQVPRRALVLGAQSAVGEMVVQQVKAMGLVVTAHVTRRFDDDDGRWWDEDVEVVVEEDAERAMGRLPDGAFALVVDTIGGKETWKMAKRILDPNGGQFTTTAGDTPETIPTRNAHVKSNMRSLRHAFSRKDDKAVGYVWICPAVDVDHDGEDVRDTLKAVTNLAAAGICVPRSERVVSFEKTPEVFNGGGMEDDEEGRPVVIRVIG